MGVQRATCKRCGNPGSRITGKMHILLGEHTAEFHLFFFFFFLKAGNSSLSRLDVQWEMPEVAVMIVGVSGWNSPNGEIISGRPRMSLRHCPSTSKARPASSSLIYLFTDDHHPLFLAPRKGAIIRRKTPATDKRELEPKRSTHEYPPRH
jgi:hypothetical protein